MRTRTRVPGAILGAALLLMVGEAAAQQPQQTVPPSTNPTDRVIYPSEEQTQEQQMSDQLACYNWSIEQTQWDPHVNYKALQEKGYVAQEQADAAAGGAVRGAARGALLGVAIGAIAGNAGKGAAIGAAAGGLAGGMRSGRARRGAQAQAERAINQFKEALSKWDRFYVACMQGRDYTVN